MCVVGGFADRALALHSLRFTTTRDERTMIMMNGDIGLYDTLKGGVGCGYGVSVYVIPYDANFRSLIISCCFGLVGTKYSKWDRSGSIKC
jgi:hypothetical protein